MRINEKMEHLKLVQEGIELNRQSIHIAARRLQLQSQMLEKLLNEMQMLLSSLNAATTTPPLQNGAA